MNLHALIALSAFLPIAGDVHQAEMKALEGRWFAGVWSFSGNRVLVVDLKNPRGVLEIAAGTAAVRWQIGAVERWSYSLGKTRGPRTMDLTVSDGTDQGKVRQAIYEIRPNLYGGYYLDLCIAEPGMSRPSEFVHKPEAGWSLYTFARYPEHSVGCVKHTDRLPSPNGGVLHTPYRPTPLTGY
jgi:uncharacterized protein (TIGR03067 family)